MSSKSFNFFFKDSFKGAYTGALFNYRPFITCPDSLTNLTLYVYLYVNFLSLNIAFRYFSNFLNIKNLPSFSQSIFSDFLRLSDVAMLLNTGPAAYFINTTPSPTPSRTICELSAHYPLFRFFRRHRRFNSKVSSRKQKFFSWGVRLLRNFVTNSRLALLLPRQKKAKLLSTTTRLLKLPLTFLLLNTKYTRLSGHLFCLIGSLLHTRRGGYYSKLVNMSFGSGLIFNKFQYKVNRRAPLSGTGLTTLLRSGKNLLLNYRSIFKKRYAKLQSLIWQNKLNINLKLVFIKLSHYFNILELRTSLFLGTAALGYQHKTLLMSSIHTRHRNLLTIASLPDANFLSTLLIRSPSKIFFKQASFMVLYKTDFFRHTVRNDNSVYFNKNVTPSPSSYVLDIIKSFFLFIINSRILIFLNFELYTRLTF